MKSLFRIALIALSLLIASVAVSAQDRQIEINANLPAKQGLLTSDIQLGGRVYLPAGNFVVVADVAFKDAVNLFLAPTDQINAGGQVWYYITGAPAKDGSSVKPFVFGGITRAMFVGAPADSTTGLAGFGVTFRRASGVTVIPTFEFNSDDFESDRTVLGKEFGAKVHIFIPLNKDFGLNLTPQVAREDNPGIPGPLPTLATGGYRTKYSLSVGFSRKF